MQTIDEYVVQTLTSGSRKTVVNGGSGARYLRTGHLLYAHGGIVLAVPFDPVRQVVLGEPVQVVEGVRRANNSRTVSAVSLRPRTTTSTCVSIGSTSSTGSAIAMTYGPP